MKFLRQKPIYVYTEESWLDRFIIADFYSATQKLILEIDWEIHNQKDVYQLDQVKEKLLQNLWYKVLRIKNEEIFWNIKWVLEKIKAY
jgi:very-short-patch-repair endonuclease